MVIYIQDFLERRRDAAQALPARVVAVAGGHPQTATWPRTRSRLTRGATLVGHEQLAAIAVPATAPDWMTLYAEASLI